MFKVSNMVDSIRPVKRPTELEDYTQFMKGCIIDTMKGFNRDGSKVSFDEAFERCRESWIETKGKVESPTPNEIFADFESVLTTEAESPLLTEGLDFLVIEG